MPTNDDFVNDAVEKEEIQRILDWIREIFDCYEWGDENTKKDQVVLALEAMGFEKLFYGLIFFVSCMAAEDETKKSDLVKKSLATYLVQADKIKNDAIRILGEMNLGRLGILAKVEGLRIDKLVKNQILGGLPREQLDAVLFVAAYIIFLPQVAKEQGHVLFAKGIEIFQSRAWDVFIAAIQRRLAQQSC